MMKRLVRWMIMMFMIYSITSLTYRLWPPSIPVNRIVGFTVILLVFFILFSRKHHSPSDFMVISFMVFCSLISLAFSTDYDKCFTNISYWVGFILSFRLIADTRIIAELKENLKKARSWIIPFVVIANLVIIASFFWSESYQRVGDNTYFMGFAYAPHPFCSSVTLLLVLSLSLFEFESLSAGKLILFVPGTLAILQSGARTYLVFVLIFWLIVYMYYLRSRAVKWMLLPLSIIAVGYILINGTLADRLDYLSIKSAQSANVLSTLTSGRTEFWRSEILAYLDLGWLNKMLGMGFDYVYKVNVSTYGMEIWAHNDFLNILLSCGVVGVVVYLVAFAQTLSAQRRMGMKRSTVWILALYSLFIAFFNGLYPYQNSVYCHVILCALMISNDKPPSAENVWELAPKRK